MRASAAVLALLLALQGTSLAETPCPEAYEPRLLETWGVQKPEWDALCAEHATYEASAEKLRAAFSDYWTARFVAAVKSRTVTAEEVAAACAAGLPGVLKLSEKTKAAKPPPPNGPASGIATTLAGIEENLGSGRVAEIYGESTARDAAPVQTSGAANSEAVQNLGALNAANRGVVSPPPRYSPTPEPPAGAPRPPAPNPYPNPASIAFAAAFSRFSEMRPPGYPFPDDIPESAAWHALQRADLSKPQTGSYDFGAGAYVRMNADFPGQRVNVQTVLPQSMLEVNSDYRITPDGNLKGRWSARLPQKSLDAIKASAKSWFSSAFPSEPKPPSDGVAQDAGGEGESAARSLSAAAGASDRLETLRVSPSLSSNRLGARVSDRLFGMELSGEGGLERGGASAARLELHDNDVRFSAESRGQQRRVDFSSRLTLIDPRLTGAVGRGEDEYGRRTNVAVYGPGFGVQADRRDGEKSNVQVNYRPDGNSSYFVRYEGATRAKTWGAQVASPKKGYNLWVGGTRDQDYRSANLTLEILLDSAGRVY